jgi:NDP-sugar pyrophosphorylase family protein
MALIIPMSGVGKRFMDAGYAKPKPLIVVDGKPVIEHVLEMYPDEDKIIFICNEEHLMETDMLNVLTTLRPGAVVLPIKPHNNGPVWAIKQAYDLVDDDEDVMISYCDFTGRWNYADFKRTVEEEEVDGAIPSYIGFHPHLIGPNFYGHMRCNEQKLMLEIKEKASFTDDKMNEYGAVGSYWFRTGAIMKKYFDEALASGMKTGNEFFCSMPYNLLVRDGLKVLIYEMPQFCQWGTPEDLEEYEAWSRAFAVLAGKQHWKGPTEIPPAREHMVQRRIGSAENLSLTFDYWRKFFAASRWHPYE